jgi:hypothetical protein
LGKKGLEELNFPSVSSERLTGLSPVATPIVRALRVLAHSNDRESSPTCLKHDQCSLRSPSWIRTRTLKFRASDAASYTNRN